MCLLSVAVVLRASSSNDEVAMLQKMLDMALERKKKESKLADSVSSGYSGPAFTIKTFNAISEVGLQRFEAGKYKVRAHTILVFACHKQYGSALV